MNDDIFIFDESGTILKGVKYKSVKSVIIPDGVTINYNNYLVLVYGSYSQYRQCAL